MPSLLDTGILTKNVDANHGSEATTYANYLVGQIKVGLCCISLFGGVQS